MKWILSLTTLFIATLLYVAWLFSLAYIAAEGPVWLRGSSPGEWGSLLVSVALVSSLALIAAAILTLVEIDKL